jgi:hypothetical protein
MLGALDVQEGHSSSSADCHVRYLYDMPHDSTYYAKSLFAGALACGLTHAAITPLDVAKTNMQASLIYSPFGLGLPELKMVT